MRSFAAFLSAWSCMLGCAAADEPEPFRFNDVQLKWAGDYRLAWSAGIPQPNDPALYSFRLKPLVAFTEDNKVDKSKNVWSVSRVPPWESQRWIVRQLPMLAYHTYGLAASYAAGKVECLAGDVFVVLCRAEPGFEIEYNAKTYVLKTGLFGFVKQNLVEYEKSEIK